MEQHDPHGTPMQAVEHYAAQGSPFVTVTVLPDALWVHAVQPEHRPAIERATQTDLVLVALAQIERAEANERG